MHAPFTEKHPSEMSMPFWNVDVALPPTLKLLLTLRLPENVDVELIPVTLMNPWMVDVPIASPWIVVVEVSPI